MDFKSLASVQTAIAQNELTLVKLVEHYLQQISQKADLNAFLEVFGEEALRQAEAIDAKLKAGTAGRLAGMVLGLKDNICYKGHKVSASSKILGGFESLYTATALQNLLNEDVIVIGRLNCDEFAMGSSNENSAFGNVKNPLNPALVPGGSSGGSAAAVAAGLCLASLGSDTGGSIRQPASFCGVVGLKPTYGRISRQGLIAYGSSFDQIGPLTHTVADCALLLEIMSGNDPGDATSSKEPVPKRKALSTVKTPQRIAYLRECVESEGLDPEIKAYFQNLIKKLQDEGHVVEAVDFPFLKYLVPTYYVLTTAEASSNLSRFDGMRYGYRSPEGKGVEDTIIKSRSEAFGPEVQRRIMLGTFVLSAGYYDAYYSKAQKVRRIIKETTDSYFNSYDFLLTPTTPGTAFPIGGKNEDPIKMYLEDIFTVQANICGLPAVSLPMGKHSNGMPFGVQVMSREFAENELLSFSANLINESL